MRWLFAAAAVVFAGCGHVIPGSLTGDGRAFDFADPPCTARRDTDAAKVEVHYLGSGGLYVRWRNDALLLGPQFSNPGIVRAGLWKSDFDRARIARALASLDLSAVRAILIGHSHYDHIGDLPVVAREPYVPTVPIYVNATGKKLLHSYEDLQARANVIQAGDAFDAGAFHIRAIGSGHAPQLCPFEVWPCVYGRGDVKNPWSGDWPTHRLKAFRGGETLAFDITIRDGSTPRYRIYYNDSSASSPLGQTTGDFDLAVLTMAQWKWVRDYPRDLLLVLRPRHVLVSHWDNFFSKSEDRFPFVPNLSNAGAAEYLTIVKNLVSGGGAPSNEVCGVKTAHYTMPLPRSSLLFEPHRPPPQPPRSAVIEE